MEENGTAAFQKGPHTLNHEPEAKEKSPPKQVRYKKPIRAAVKMGGNYSDGFCATSPSNNRTVYFDT